MKKIFSVIKNRFNLFKLWLNFDILKSGQVLKRFGWGKVIVYDDWMGRNIYTGNFEKEEMYALKQVLRDDSVILDIGGNIGFHAVFFATHCKCKVYSFEPSSREFKRLSKNVVINNLQDKITPVKMALGSSEGEIELFLDDENTGKNSILNPSKEAKSEKVLIGKLDNFIAENQIPRIDLIKIDVEGFELEVLKGAQGLLNEKKPVIFFEDLKLSNQYNSQMVNENPVYNLLVKNGYTVNFINHQGMIIPVTQASEISGTNFFAFPA